MRVAWVHPSWRDLVIEHLAADDQARERFLRASSVHGVLLALSTEGGREGARRLPLLREDRDWDALSDRVHALARDLEPTELIGLLGAVGGALSDSRGNAAGTEADALARSLLARVSGKWTAARTPIAVGELTAWLQLAGRLTPRPPPPPLAITWVELAPVAPPEIADHRALERFADWLGLAEALAGYDTAMLSELGFTGMSSRPVMGFLDAVAAGGAAQRLDGGDSLARALDHIRRLFPTLAEQSGAWDHVDQRAGPDESPPLDWSPTGVDPRAAEWLDVDRVLRDL